MNMKYLLLFAVALAAPTQAQAGAAPGSVSLQLFGGARSLTPDVAIADDKVGKQDLELEKFSGSEYGMSVFVQPVPLVPVAVGLYGVRQDLAAEDDTETKYGLDGFSAGLSLMSWLEVGMLQPFFKGGYDLYSSHKLRFEEGTEKFDLEGKLRGYHLAVGFQVAPAPMIAFFMEVEYAQQNMTVDKLAFESGRVRESYTLTDEDKDDIQIKTSSGAVLIGVDIGG
jgi:hypothetical protein